MNDELGTDAEKWAQQFMVAAGADCDDMTEDGLTAWFANAIEAGRGAGWVEGYKNGYGHGLYAKEPLLGEMEDYF